MGMTWIPSKETLATDKNGALEHVKQHFTTWIGRLAKAFRQHKNAAKTKEASLRTNNMTSDEVRTRDERKRRRKDIDAAVRLQDELEQAKGKTGKGGKPGTTPKSGAKGGKKGKSGAKSTLDNPRSFARMTRFEQRRLESLWSGELHARWKETRRGPIAAEPFEVADD